MSNENKTLKLVLNRKAFEITGTQEKMFELRRSSDWIRSRLYAQNGTVRNYNFVQIYDGYKTDREFMLFKYGGFTHAAPHNWSFSNGLEFTTCHNDYIIYLMPLL